MSQATAANNLVWDETGPDIPTIQAYTFKYYPDGATTGVALPAPTVSGTTSPFTCSVPFPAFTPGNHAITITAMNIAGEGPKSTPFAFTFVVVPAAPQNIRIV